MITFASQQATPWSGFNGGFGLLAPWAPVCRCGAGTNRGTRLLAPGVVSACQCGINRGMRGGFGQGAAQATMLDGTIATAQTAADGSVVGFWRLADDGVTTLLYDADGAFASQTAGPSASEPWGDLSSVFSTLSQTVTRLFAPTPQVGVGLPGASGLGGLGLGTLLLVGGAVYLLSAQSSSARRRRR